MKNKKILKIIVLIIVIIIALILIHTIRNFIIITNLQNKLTQYNDKNFYRKTISNEGDGRTLKTEYYKKDNRQVLFIEASNNGTITSKISMYNNGERTDVFTETSESKIVQLDTGEMTPISVTNQLENDTKWQTFLGSFFAKVKSKKCNEKDCYEISNYMSSYSLEGENQKNYIDKDTGIIVKTKLNDMETEMEYKFDVVNDEIFIEPDISQYELQETNS